MIELSNGHRLEFLAASGALGFDGRGWLWEWPFRWIGLLDPHLFTVVIKTLFLKPWKGNLHWYAPWRVVKFISNQGKTIHPFLALIRPDLIEGIANAIGLTGPGFEHWLKKDYPIIQGHNYKVIVSIAGGEEDCLKMVAILNELKNVVGIEYNASCPSFSLELLKNPQKVVRTSAVIVEASKHPVILKLGYTQDYCRIAKETEDRVEAIDINSVPWEVAYPDQKSLLAKYGGGGVSGKIAQPFTWKMVEELAKSISTPIIGSSIWEYEDISRLKMLGASAYHFGAIFLPYPHRPTKYVRRWQSEQK